MLKYKTDFENFTLKYMIFSKNQENNENLHQNEGIIFMQLINNVIDSIHKNDLDQTKISFIEVAKYLNEKKECYIFNDVMKQTQFPMILLSILRSQCFNFQDEILFILEYMCFFGDKNLIVYLIENNIFEFFNDQIQKKGKNVGSIMICLGALLSFLDSNKNILGEEIFDITKINYQSIFENPLVLEKDQFFLASCVYLYTNSIKYCKKIILPNDFIDLLYKITLDELNENLVIQIIKFYDELIKVKENELIIPFLQNSKYSIIKNIIEASLNSMQIDIILRLFEFLSDFCSYILKILSSIRDENDPLSFITKEMLDDILENETLFSYIIMMMENTNDDKNLSIVFKFLSKFLEVLPYVLQSNALKEKLNLIFEAINNGSYDLKYFAFKVINVIIRYGTPDYLETLIDSNLAEYLLNGLGSDKTKLLNIIISSILTLLNKYYFEPEIYKKVINAFSIPPFLEALLDLETRAEPFIVQKSIYLRQYLKFDIEEND